MIASPKSQFECWWSIESQTSHHVVLAFAMDDKDMIVQCDKIEENGANYNYKKIEGEYSFYRKNICNKVETGALTCKNYSWGDCTSQAELIFS